jgi:hypothetical protein
MHKNETKKLKIFSMKIYKKISNDWFNRDIWIERHLVLTYEIWPEQILFAIRIHKWWFTFFRDKWNERIKFLYINVCQK